VRTAIAALVLAGVVGAGAEEVRVPLRLDAPFVRRALVAQVFGEPGERATVWREPRGCGWLVLADPAVDVVGDRVRVVARGDARVGTPVAGRCLVGLQWRGLVEVFETPALEAGAVAFRVVDSNVYDERGRKRLGSGVVWDLVKAHVHPRLAAVRLDVGRTVEELRAWLPLVLPGPAERAARLLDSLTVRDVQVADGAVVVGVAVVVDPIAPAPAPAPALGAEELARWEARLERWDGFLTFVVKHVARDGRDRARAAALSVLLDARHALLAALAPAAPGAPDPVPGLFLEAWTALAPVAREVSTALPAEDALHYLSFVAAGDALAALVRLGPSVGLEVSADGLRRLARMLDPVSPTDPVAYDLAVDPELRALLGLGAPLPPPEVDPEVDLDPLSWLATPAWAAPDRAALARLNRWSPTRDDLDDYLPLVRDLLDDVQGAAVADGGLAPEHRPLYRDLVIATAWQESCWRQFVRRGGRLVPLRSPVGSVGLMQVNVRVWRGVYDREGLLGDVAYNARAGAEIALHYLRDWALARGEHRHAGGVDNLARAAYAAYNGGPGHLTRYRSGRRTSGLARIDGAFWEKYVAVRAGREMEVARCWGVDALPRTAGTGKVAR
jgi:hypothetical protein